MANRLDVNSGETYQVPQGATEEYTGADVDGTLEVNGTLDLNDDATSPNPVQPDQDGIDLPLRSINFSDMNLGFSMFLVGSLGLLLGFVAWVRAYAAGIMLALSVLVLLISGLTGLGLELFWVSLALTVVLLIAGVVVQWTR